MHVVNFYDESNIKKIRRKEILEKCSEYFIESGIENVTMKEIAEYLKVERRTLYAYYNNKLDLFLDTSLYLTELFMSSHQAFEKELYERVKGLKTKEQLTLYFKKYFEEILYSNKRNHFLLNFDSFLRTIDPETDSAFRFGSVSKQMMTEEDILEKIIRDGMGSNQIRAEYRSASQIKTVLDQSFRSYLFKTIRRTPISDRYAVKNLDLFVEIMVQGVCECE
jgi:AcrR family transcriptional regulator